MFTIRENFGIPQQVSMAGVKYRMVDSDFNKDNFSNFLPASPADETRDILIPKGYIPFDKNLNESYYNLFNKGKLCKASGLTGAEKRACKKQIKAACRNRPLLGKAKKANWDTCAAGVQIGDQEVSQSQSEITALEQKEKAAGLSTGAKIGLGAGAFIASLLLMYVIIASTKKTPVPIAVAK